MFEPVFICLPGITTSGPVSLIVDLNEISVGLVVDKVREVVVIPEHQVELPPVAGKSTAGRYIQGIGKINDEIEIILNVKNPLFDNELTQ